MPVHVHDRSTPPWPLAAALVLLVLLVLLSTLGFFQYKWLGEVSEAERARMRESPQTRANDFAAEFDRELTRTYLAFHMDSEALDRDPAKTMTEAFTAAQASGAARIVKAVYLLEGDGQRLSLRRLDA